MIFVVGNSRSGTTMLGSILGNHSQVYTFGELHFFEQLVPADKLSCPNFLTDNKKISMLHRLFTSSRDGLFEPVVNGRYKDEVSRFISDGSVLNALELYEKFLEHETSRNRKSISCEQTPRYLFSIEEIFKNLPNAKVVCMVRDPRDVLLSQKHRWKRRRLSGGNMPWIWVARSWANYHPYTSSRIWASAARIALECAHHPRFRIVKYEDLLCNPEITMKSICDFVDLGYEESMLNVQRIGSSTSSDSPEKLGIDRGNTEKWKNGGLTITEVAICETTTNKFMSKFDYSTEGSKVSIASTIIYLCTFLIKSNIALVININRLGGLFEYIRRRK